MLRIILYYIISLQKVHGHLNYGYLSCMFDLSTSGTEQMYRMCLMTYVTITFNLDILQEETKGLSDRLISIVNITRRVF